MILPKEGHEPADVARHYEQLDPFYRELWGEHLHHGLWLPGTETPGEAVLQLSRFVAERAGIGPGTEVCDVGSGYGATARLLVDEYDVRVTALTVTPAQFEYAQSVEPGASNPRYLLRAWEDNGLADESFSAVIAIESTAHMADKAGAIGEAWRVLRPGGRLVICAWLSREAPSRWEERHLLEPICREGRLAGMGTEGEYRNWLGSAGFAVEAFEDLSRRVARTWSVCIRRAVVGVARKPAYRAFLLNAKNRDRVFPLAMLRIRAAYAAGAMRYGVFTARRS